MMFMMAVTKPPFGGVITPFSICPQYSLSESREQTLRNNIGTTQQIKLQSGSKGLEPPNAKLAHKFSEMPGIDMIVALQGIQEMCTPV